MCTSVSEPGRPAAAGEVRRDGCPASAGPARHLRASAAHGYIRLEIRAERLYSLMSDRALVIEDFRVVDSSAKHWLKRRLLELLIA